MVDVTPERATNPHLHVLRGAARNSLVGAAGSVLASTMGFVFAILVGRSLGAGGSGVFFAAVAIAMVLIAVGTSGADTGLLWALSRDTAAHGGRSHRYLIRIAMLPVTVVSLVLGSATWLVAPAIGDVIGSGHEQLATHLVRIMCVALVCGPVLQCLVQGSRGLGNVLPFTMVQQIGVPVVRVVMLGLMALFGASLSGEVVAISWVVPLAVFLPVAFVVVRRRAAEPSRDATAHEGLAGEFWRYSLFRGAGTTGSLALVWLDVAIVAALASPAAAGGYAAASRFATSGQLGLQAMRLGISPEVSAAFAKGDLPRVSALYGLSTQWATLLSWPVFLNLVFFADAVLGWFGEGFGTAVLPLRILCIAMMLSVATGNVATIVMMSGASGASTRNTLLALAVTVGFDLAVVPHWAATGAAVGWTLGVVVENGLGLWLVTRRLKVFGHDRRFWTTAVVMLVLATSASTISHLILGHGTSAFLTSSLLTGVGVLCYIWLARRSLELDVLLGRNRKSKGGSSVVA